MDYRESFIRFMTECEVLKFGEFTLKSGRKAPYFINTGNYRTGAQLAKLGEYYAECIKENRLSADTLFGPAYKGIPLACACSIALYAKYGFETNYLFDRKEVKDHGEGGSFVGKKLEDGERVLIIEDVITAGTAVREVIPMLRGAADVVLEGMVISVDRMEKGNDGRSAVEAVFEEFGLKVYSIITVNDIISALERGIIKGAEFLPEMCEYRETYGAAAIEN